VRLASFHDLVLVTRPGVVMTPRPAGERLAATALDVLGGRPAIVADVGTGSGALALAIAAAAPRAQLWATDTSPAAVALARENVRRHGLAGRVVVREGDLLDPVPGSVDLVVANLPYLPLGERGLDGDLAAEPEEALFAAGDGLDPYRRLIGACGERLTSEGALVIQFRRRVLHAGRDELEVLRRRLEDEATLALEAA
jgi:release factor glutamine methyltransferase